MTDGVLTGKALLLAQENLLIAALRRPRMSSIMKRTGLNEGHFLGHLRAAFNIAVTKSQDENSAAGHARGSSHLAALWEADPRMEGSSGTSGGANETPEEREFLQKTLGAIRHILGALGEISSKRLACELAQIEGGPWAQWGRGREKKPIVQNALARLLRPHNVSPVDVGPVHARRKGYKRDQFEHLFRSLPRPASSAP